MSPQTRDEKMYLNNELFESLQEKKREVELLNREAEMVANAGVNLHSNEDLQ